MFIKLLLLFLLLSNLAYSQKINFSNNTDQFYNQFIEFIDQKSTLEIEDLQGSFTRIYKSIDDNAKSSFIECIKIAIHRKISNKYIMYFTNTVVLLYDLSRDNETIDHYLLINKNKFEKDNDKNILKSIKLNHDFLSDNIIKRDISIVYTLENIDEVSLDKKFKEFVYNIKGTIFGYYNKRNKIELVRDIKAKFYVQKNVIKYDVGILFWNNNDLDKDTYNRLENGDIILDDNKLIITNSNIFNIPRIKLSNVKGSLYISNKYFKTKSKKHIVFESHNHIDSMRINNSIIFNGMLRLRGENVEFFSSKDKEANMILYRRGKVFINTSSSKFVFNQNNVYSSDTFVDIIFGGKSIYSSSVSLFYGIKNDILEIQMKNKMPYRIFFSDTYHMMDVFLDKLSWRLNDSLMYFSSRYKNIGIMSQRSYDPLLLKKFKGLNSVNTIIKIKKIFDKKNKEFLSFDEVSQALNIKQSDMIIIIMELNKYGLIRMEIDKKRLSLSNKLNHLINSKTGNYDYDKISFFIEKDKDLVGKFNLDSLSLKIRGIGDVNIDNSMMVSLDLRGEDIDVYKNINFLFSGKIFVSHNNFVGDNNFFDYDNYKIDINNSKLNMYVPISKKDSYGRYRAKKIKNAIDSIRGKLYINKPDNKSSNRNFPKYPYLKTQAKSYIFYDDKNIQKGLYSRDRFYVKLDTFSIYSMSNVNKKILKQQFEGVFYSGGIFPTFKPKIKLQKDLSIGFSTFTTKHGLDIFSKFNYKGSLSLNYKGFKGAGYVRDKNTAFESKEITFWLDSIFASKSKLNIKKVYRRNTPGLLGVDVDVKYYPKQDSLKLDVYENQSYISIYDDKVKSKGDFTTNVNADNIYGKGILDYGGIEMTSNRYKFKKDYFEAKSIKLEIKDEQKNTQFKIENAFGKVDVKNKIGTFEFNDTSNNYMDFNHNSYRVFLNKIKWDIDKSTINMKNKNPKDKHLLISTSKTTDSISFEALESIYDIKNKTIVSKGVDEINVLDIIVKPHNRRVFIKENGLFDKFTKAQLILNRYNEFHKLYDVDILLNSKNKYQLINANYGYIDSDSIITPIKINKLVYDKDKQNSTAYANIEKNKMLMLSPYFNFYGKMELIPSNEHPLFKGFIHINNGCRDINVGNMPINTHINPKEIELDTGYFKGAPLDMYVYSGIYNYAKTYKSAFISNENSLEKNKFISVRGKLRYNEIIDAYTVTEYNNGSPVGRASYYEDQCIMKAYGNMLFNNKNFVSYNAYGEYQEVINDNTQKQFLLTIGINFFLDEDIINSVFSELEIADVPEISYENRSYNVAMDIINADDQFDFENDFNYELLLTDLEFKWDDKNKSFIADSVGVGQIGRSQIGKKFEGKVVIYRTLLGDRFTIYFKNKDNYYYFNFGDNMLDFYTNNKEVLKVYEAVEIENRNKDIDGKEFRYGKPRLSEINVFKRKFNIK